MVTPAAKRKAAGGLRQNHPASERRICRLLGMHRSTARSRPEPGRGDGPLADRLRELARWHPRCGYLTLHHIWSERSGATPDFIQTGKPTQNAFVESFNGKFRDSCLNQHWFKGLADVRRIVDDWRHHYNHERPHSSLGSSTPAERAKQAA